MTIVGNMSLNVFLLNLVVSFTCAQTTTLCPGGVALLGSDYTIVGDRSNYSEFTWVRENGVLNVVICNDACSSVAGYDATMNATHSTLVISSTGVIDVGTWALSDANVPSPVPVGVCQLTAAEVPRCSISSDEDTDSLEPGTQLTLTVDITGYYCSLETGFDLTTGDVTEELGRHNVTNVSNITVTTNFNVDITRFGDVTLGFSCYGKWDVTCNGVQQLLKTPPQCNISSDTDTTALDPGTNLTLTVDLRNYYCSQGAGFKLTTGRITETLLENQTMDNISDTVLTQSLLVTADYFGDVTVTFICDGITRPLVCDGVDKLSGSAPSTGKPTVTAPDTTVPTHQPSTTSKESPTKDDTVPLALGLSLGVGLILVIVIVLIVRSRRNKLTLK